ncbi:glycosyltransferase family 4 protein [Persicitalea sp.]|uniref:glycosyltransferase family 4 protein n=1 Tax=Persicitalea sp. TaxID=3100273 RepID=UPI003593945F
MGHCFELAALDRSRFRHFLVKTIARIINRSNNPTVFGANATFVYELIPYLHESIKIVDLTHSFVPESDYPVERASLPYVGRLATRVVINGKTKQDYANLYQAEGVPDDALNNILVVHNKLNYPYWDLAQKDYSLPPLKVLFVGRNSPEKRIGLIARVAHALRDEPVKFTFVGPDLERATAYATRSNLHFMGELTDSEALARIYQEHHVILIASRREGFPLVLAEGMAHGAVPVSTDVGGISHHVQDGKNGFLVENSEDANLIVQAIVTRLRYLVDHPEVLPKLGEAAQTEAYRSFAPEVFDRTWRELLTS